MHRDAALVFPGLVAARLVTVNYLVFRNCAGIIAAGIFLVVIQETVFMSV
jgi:hypothetical protein